MYSLIKNISSNNFITCKNSLTLKSSLNMSEGCVKNHELDRLYQFSDAVELVNAPSYNAASEEKPRIDDWKSAWNDPTFRVNMVVALTFTIIFPIKTSSYFDWVEKRQGCIVLTDYVLDLLPPTDVSWAIFALLYGCATYTFYNLRNKPKEFLWLFWSFNLETTLRFLCIYLVPLETPPGLIVLSDPISERIVYGTDAIVTKDLFFSGHTSTIVLATFFASTPKERYIGSGLVLLTGILLLLQHVHYTIDVVAAPIFTLLSIYLTKRISMN